MSPQANRLSPLSPSSFILRILVFSLARVTSTLLWRPDRASAGHFAVSINVPSRYRLACLAILRKIVRIVGEFLRHFIPFATSSHLHPLSSPFSFSLLPFCLILISPRPFSNRRLLHFGFSRYQPSENNGRNVRSAYSVCKNSRPIYVYVYIYVYTHTHARVRWFQRAMAKIQTITRSRAVVAAAPSRR